jgi:flavodoxin-like protein
MKRALVIFESMYGNTEQVGQAIGDGLADVMDVEVVEVGAAPITLAPDIRLIVVGGPTHAFGMSRPGTRAAAAKDAESPLVSSGIGVREWLEKLEPAAESTTAAAYDTHADHPRLLRHMGSAASAIAKHLDKLGFQVVANPEHFWVSGTLGPLAEGELDRAREFGRSLAQKARVTDGDRSQATSWIHSP